MNAPTNHAFDIAHLGHVEVLTDRFEKIGACRFTVNNKTSDLARTKEHGGGMGLLHHLTYATDQRGKTCARLILAPDWQVVRRTETDRKKGQAWGLNTIDTFHTHGTPPVKIQQGGDHGSRRARY